MSIRLKKNLLISLLAWVVAGSIMPSRADISDNLPEIGTTAAGTLSINQELAMGDFYVRQLRASAPVRQSSTILCSVIMSTSWGNAWWHMPGR
ncbi:TPR repeat-containing protein [Erwinia amylovora]|nr:hypothetical protein EHX00_1057 [Erwinia amylovora]QJQ57462.1 TPR repeat-containing protein [Erwinia amylovora]QJQ61161.1 hypothetical protein EHW98_1057 [Erwinia amylovora]QJQ64963.1 hypothetical protein EHW96_1057 [Erwinia amylovora]QJQ68662.1 hypothetical protein EGZ89_1057 [Erwinia amylovora]